MILQIAVIVLSGILFVILFFALWLGIFIWRHPIKINMLKDFSPQKMNKMEYKYIKFEPFLREDLVTSAGIWKVLGKEYTGEFEVEFGKIYTVSKERADLANLNGSFPPPIFVTFMREFEFSIEELIDICNFMKELIGK